MVKFKTTKVNSFDIFHFDVVKANMSKMGYTSVCLSIVNIDTVIVVPSKYFYWFIIL